jgi:hypothetical protein
MTAQSFTRNYRDYSNESGYQYEFFCDKCGNGHRSSFETSTSGVAASMLKAAGAFFGGGLARAGWSADHLKNAFRGPAWDAAFQRAIEECKPKFRQCTTCGHWVCPEVCWNQARGLCEACAPDLGEQAAAIQAQVAVQQAWVKAAQVDQTRGVDVAGAPAAVGALCPNCQAALAPAAKFCAGCGTPVQAKKKFCDQCGGELDPGARFCSGCGAQAQ